MQCVPELQHLLGFIVSKFLEFKKGLSKPSEPLCLRPCAGRMHSLNLRLACHEKLNPSPQPNHFKIFGALEQKRLLI